MAGGLAALTIVLKAPFQGTTPGGLTGPTLLLPALAAAVLAKMDSLPVAFLAGVGLGVLEQLVLWNSDVPSAVDLVFLLVILVGLLARKEKQSRVSAAPSVVVGRGRRPAHPQELKHLPEVRGSHGPWRPSSPSGSSPPRHPGPATNTTLSLALIWGMVGISLVVLTGWGGHISLGQFAIVGAGAVAAGNIVYHWDLDLFVALLVSGVTGGLLALLLGLPALRIRGLFLAVTTLAFAIALDSYFLNPTYFDAQSPRTSSVPCCGSGSRWRRPRPCTTCA